MLCAIERLLPYKGSRLTVQNVIPIFNIARVRGYLCETRVLTTSCILLLSDTGAGKRDSVNDEDTFKADVLKTKYVSAYFI